MKKRFPLSIFLRLVTAGLLFWALEGHPYDYYTLLRWVSCATAGYCVYIAIVAEKTSWVWAFGVIGLLFNPIIPVHLSRETWAVIDVGAGIVLTLSIFFIRESNIKT